MAVNVTFIVIPFSTDKLGRLKPGAPQNMKNRDKALLAAGRMSVYSAGVVVIEQETDAATDFFSEPKFVAHYGQIPEGMLEQLVA